MAPRLFVVPQGLASKCYLKLEQDGTLVIYDAETNRAVWNNLKGDL